MRRILACLAILALPATAFGGEPLPQGSDPIGDALAAAQSTPGSAFDLNLKVSLYHGGRGMGGHDSLGCPVRAMRTVAVDPSIVARRSIIFIKETVGMPLPDGGVHDGFWFASDIGGGIKGSRIDLFTGSNAGTMRALSTINMKAVTVTKVGQFEGCPPADGGEGKPAANPWVPPLPTN
jgi:3D (Asp-Asp-Asp) domain-containing protein